MLSKLSISNYALIDSLEIDFKGGLTIITGETGAGKSIILGALSSILGELADARSIRNAEQKSVIEGVFDISKYDMERFFIDNDIEYFGSECILRREILPNGRTRAFVNDSPVGLALLKELAIQIIDIHSQHNNLLLSKPAYQLAVIDSIAGDKELLEAYKGAYSKYVAARKELEALRQSLEKRVAEEDYFRFQLSQLAALDLKEGEDAELEALHSKLSNATEIKELLWSAETVLGDNDNSVVDGLNSARASLDMAGKNYVDALPLSERLSSVIIELKDIYSTVHELQEDVVYDPRELERVEERLNAIYDLERKHGMSSVDELLAYQAKLEAAIGEIDNGEELVAEKEKAVKAYFAEASKLAENLSAVRKSTAGMFSAELESMSRSLGLANIKFEVEFSDSELKADGKDNVGFMVAFNKQQALMPVEATASGGEISRLMLCIKTIIAKSMNLPTVIFDEIDTGVSGEVASKIGAMMRDMSQNLQVVAITHLPQVAVKGHQHYKVYKTDTASSTVTSVMPLDTESRIREIAAMLSGTTIGQAAIDNAKALLEQNI